MFVTVNYVQTKKTQKAPTVIYESVVDDLEESSGQRTISGRIYLPPRFVGDFKQGTPVVYVYRGMKKARNGRTFHDLQSIKAAANME